MRYIFLSIFLLSTLTTLAQTDAKLIAQLKAATKGFNGDVGIYVQNLKTGKTVAINADTLFPTASMIKVSILSGLMDKIEKGEMQYNQKLVYRDSLLYAGEDILGSFKDKDTIQLSKVALLMITMSDNTASVWLQKLVGGEYINNLLDANGFKVMRVNSRIPARRSFWEKYGWGVTTPREMCRLFTMIRQGKVVSPAASERMSRMLNRIFWDETSLSQIPPYVQTMSKQGAVDASRSETVLVNAPHGDYVFSVITKNNKDQRWTKDNEADILIKKVSALLWHYYEPGSKWQPAAGVNKYMLNE
ncbi:MULTISPECIES: serine hydrolase [unclassified Mucilaginibacter]|uniref:serine hydrolase n=1 Tax=unclassified Mucilaginibacter TaxID=2617802 RepID=UPI002AC8A3CA|nr:MULTISPECIES: serine hydrolase [unclassified Mucilaginibacter]MEB0261303.1 serine hydrolase [Mucilaginibacter sp. 10I4]MEB0280434.1 serine hydrolase [Mucilaginibacter sp. 10B2]MEB0300456.1 serine hydrolase [Mucilaginibacter sp. 5C4]WPX23109.1 serine hydrolase [Mucilaginibacter sp. 5C4]